MKTRKKGYKALLILTIIFTLAAISTVLPGKITDSITGATPKISEKVVGYRAHCTFTPISTAICFALSAATCVIRKRKFTGETS